MGGQERRGHQDLHRVHAIVDVNDIGSIWATHRLSLGNLEKGIKHLEGASPPHPNMAASHQVRSSGSRVTANLGLLGHQHQRELNIFCAPSLPQGSQDSQGRTQCSQWLASAMPTATPDSCGECTSWTSSPGLCSWQVKTPHTQHHNVHRRIMGPEPST